MNHSSKTENVINQLLKFTGWKICICALVALIGILPLPSLAQDLKINSEQTPLSQEFVDEGIKVVFSMSHVDQKKTAGEFKEGDDVKFRFEISDTLTGKGFSGTFPAAWMSLLSIAEMEGKSVDCSQKVSSYVGGNLSQKAELDLNVYYVLTLNTNATISVVDPLFSFGGSQLLTSISLNSSGSDWVVSKDQAYVYVAMPKAKQIAVIRTSDWKVIQNIDINGIPSRVVLQGDNHYLWVGYEHESEHGGVVVINTEDFTIESHIATGNGFHDLVVDAKSRFTYVTNKTEGITSIIDVQSLTKIKDITTGPDPISITYSAKSNTVLVANQSSGNVVVIDGKRHIVLKTIPTAPGIFQIKFEPEGRLAFGINPYKDELYIIDASTNRLVQTGHMESQPDQVNFSDEIAYIRHRNSSTILMVPLDACGQEGTPVQVADFPAGQAPPSQGIEGCLAPGMVKAPGVNGMLIANSPDESIYYYT
ncbi:MAG: YncE family protein [Flavobacteriales bacterium]|nr:YncE family protein [Flavobacteriales bacterium]